MASKMITDENYIQISGWMINRLNLKGNELFVYAIIYSFSQDGESEFRGSLQYLADWTNTTPQGVLKVLKNLVKKGLITKNETKNGFVKYCTYRVTHETKFNGVSDETKFNGTVKQSLMGDETKFNGAVKQSLMNNTNNKQEYNKQDDNTNGANAQKQKKNEMKETTDLFLKCWGELYEKGKVSTPKPLVNWAVCSRLISSHIKSGLTYEQVQKCIAKAMSDEWIVSNGFSLQTILGSSQMNKLLNAKNGGANNRNGGRRWDGSEIPDFFEVQEACNG